MENPFKPAKIFNSDFFITDNYFMAITTNQLFFNRLFDEI